MYSLIEKAKEKIRKAERLVAFTGAGISITSGIPPFRGPGGLWSKYDPSILDIDFFISNPKQSWKYIKEIFYEYLLKDVKPNPAHVALAKLTCPVITQNIDNLHQAAGSEDVIEFHGTAQTLVCMDCSKRFNRNNIDLSVDIPRCDCGGVLKPDFVFFGEQIPKDALDKSFMLAQICDVMLVVGTTGEIMPASQIPIFAKNNGAFIIEVNPNPSNYTGGITDIFLQYKAEEVLPKLVEGVKDVR
ncbi:SIR2 family NAD-dependent protein deacylase [Hippea maritima]|uniref:protein acetyllysine N-acetyltransferase n=1 Tax=Hippea maritima (strain ATCC 700847 / DSM 10411 / MH2) TaxID=760142 RepID=F2LUQ0_HIPMA|nr:NAD-dependent deacylase [Hippea maritima]AEA33505.1 NAD-dependent deacetylase [Hippea maritima DSM 10411]